MSKIDALIDAIKATANNARQAQLRWAFCKSVDWDNKTMVAIGQSDDLEYYDVILGIGASCQKPSIGALCLIGVLEGEETATFLLSASEVEEYIINSKGGNIHITNGEISLCKLIKNLTDLLKTFEMYTPSGVTAGITPKTLKALTDFETEFKQLLKDA